MVVGDELMVDEMRIGELAEKEPQVKSMTVVRGGQASWIKLMDQLNATEEQRKVTLRDGQDAGGLLLDIESRIGELAEKEERAKVKPTPERLPNGRISGGGALPSGKPPKPPFPLG